MSWPVDPIASNLYALDVYQADLYTYQCNIWGLDPNVPWNAANMGDPAGNYILLYENVPCYLESTPEYDEPTPMGRTQSINIFSLDKWHFNALQPVQDGWALKMTASPQSTNILNKWWEFMSNTQTHTYLAEKLRIYAKRTIQPQPGWARADQPTP